MHSILNSITGGSNGSNGANTVVIFYRDWDC